MTQKPRIAASSQPAAEDRGASGHPAAAEAALSDRRGKRRRPSGEAPPLPRRLERTGHYWLGLSVAVLAAWGVIFGVQGAGIEGTRADLAMLRPFIDARTPGLTAVARAVEFIGSDIILRIVRWSALLVLLYFRRFRHLFVFFGSILAVGAITTFAAFAIARPRPLGIDILTSWEGPSQPSRPVAALTVTLVGITYSLVVAGKARNRAKWGAAAFVVLFCLTRLYLGVDHPSDVFVAVIIGVAVPLIAFRLLTPNDVFPVTYTRGRSAHLDVGGARGLAIRTALEEQLGLKVLDMAPFGLGGSGGSTPLRLRVEGEEDEYLFAKLYAKNHLRADRWYKLGRTLLYGRLEDEAAFSTVRRLIQYEDYLLRVMQDAGLNVPRSYGIAEITPEREYLLVTSFVDGAKELLDAEVDDEVIDDGLREARALWDAGVAHRDIKPSNVLVRGSKVYLIDVAFGEVRPSPWRQAVDLANMMLVLAFRTSPEKVYEHALEVFSPEEIAEAFAATHSVTMPSQSRNLLRKAQGDLIARFRELAPKRRPVAIQRWTWRRIVLTLTVLFSGLLAIGITVGNLGGFGLFSVPSVPIPHAPDCQQPEDPVILMAQSVETASRVPCLDSLPVGWSFDSLYVRNGSSRFLLSYDRENTRPVTVLLEPSCDTSGASEVPSDEEGTRRFERIRVIGDVFSGDRIYTFEGGCVRYEFDFVNSRSASLANEVSLGLGFLSRAEGESMLRRETGLDL
jgi:tRNA A-37 threonylcarbamoyl transferase component Bud32/membrane-associated phospholipid phosphatase